MIELFGHPFSSYTWKALIACYENDIPITFRMVDTDHPENVARLQALSPQGKFPLLIEGDVSLFESSVIIEYLQMQHPGATVFIPTNPDAALHVRMLDRFFDGYVMTPMNTIVVDFMRDPDLRDSISVDKAKAMLLRSYTWLNHKLEQQDQPFICATTFTLADCAAAPSLFYADWVAPITNRFTALQDYRARLLQRPSVKRCVDEARPYRHFFPPGAPDRD